MLIPWHPCLLKWRMAIPIKWGETLSALDVNIENCITELKFFCSKTNSFKLTIKTSSKEFYAMLLQKKTGKYVPSGKTKWSNLYSLKESDWKNIYLHAFYSCRNTKLQSFQYRIINRTITTNHWLFNAKLKDNPNCDTCHTNDTLEHVFC